MKLVTYLDGHLRVGAIVEDRVADLSERFDSIQMLIEGGEPALEEARSLAAKANRAAEVAEVELRAPIPQPSRTPRISAIQHFSILASQPSRSC